MLTARNARHMGLHDCGIMAPGMKADLNVIDRARLAAQMPALVHDLPAGGKCFVQKARGYVATLCNGHIVCAEGTISDTRPGRWVKAA